MKKYLQNRNEQLFNKLFENQGLKADLAESVDEEDVNMNPPGTMDDETFRNQENTLLQRMRDWFNPDPEKKPHFPLPPSVAQIGSFIQGASDVMGAEGRLGDAWRGITILSKGGQSTQSTVHEDIPQWTAAQKVIHNLEEKEEQHHDVDAQGTLTARLQAEMEKFLNRNEVSPHIKKVDTAEELTYVLNAFGNILVDIVGQDINDEEFKRAASNFRELVIKRGGREKEEKDNVEETHVLISPNGEENKKERW